MLSCWLMNSKLWLPAKWNVYHIVQPYVYAIISMCIIIMRDTLHVWYGIEQENEISLKNKRSNCVNPAEGTVHCPLRDAIKLFGICDSCKSPGRLNALLLTFTIISKWHTCTWYKQHPSIIYHTRLITLHTGVPICQSFSNQVFNSGQGGFSLLYNTTS